MPSSVTHDTLVLERDYPAAPARVFAAFADPEARLRWGPPSDTVRMIYEATDFRVGGQDIAWCGSGEALSYRVETRYEDIVPNARLVMTETVSEDGGRLSVSLITVTFVAQQSGTRLVLIDQIAALDGSDMVTGSRMGWSASLDNLNRELGLTAETA
jgi:uncharacterized protein YndB with AHSA1/START domain